jgi:hypothetical protein
MASRGTKRRPRLDDDLATAAPGGGGGSLKRSRQEGEMSTERGGTPTAAGGAGGGDPMLKLVMERERVRVIEAYKALQKKRREESGGRNFSTLD